MGYVNSKTSPMVVTGKYSKNFSNNNSDLEWLVDHVSPHLNSHDKEVNNNDSVEVEEDISAIVPQNSRTGANHMGVKSVERVVLESDNILAQLGKGKY